MSDLVSCPTCQTTLRLPPAAATVRCPKCKTLLEVLDEGGQPSAEPDAPPLPFAGASPKAQPGQPKKASRRVTRPELVDEQGEAAEKEARQSVVRKREIRQRLRKLDEQEEVEEERYEEIDEQCGWGRMALGWLRYGMAGYATGILLVFFSMLGFVIFTLLGTPFGAVMAPIAFLGLATGGLATLILMVGFGIALRGPKMPRHIAVFGLVVTASQVIVLAAGLGAAIGKVTTIDEDRGLDEGFGGMEMAYYVLGLVTNQFLMADVPTRMVKAYPFPMLGVVAGVFEFARLVFVCQLIQAYADLGKNDRASSDAGKGISRVFWVILLTCMFRFAISMGFDWFPHKDTMWLIGQVLHGLLFIVAFGFFGFRLLMIAQAAADSVETLLADRVTSTATKLDVV